MDNHIDYIFVDLDGTLIKTDLFIEAIIKLIKQNPFNVFRLCAWLLKGRSFAKDRLACLVSVGAETLPYREELLNYLKEQKTAGKTIVLTTASHENYANAVAEHLELFDKVLATNLAVNLKGIRKLDSIREYVGKSEFIYVGDSSADRPIWEHASRNIYVDAPKRDVDEGSSRGKVLKVINTKGSISVAFFKQMRIHQWAKNSLIFVPIFASHQYHNLSLILSGILAFLSFSFCASGVYFLNDLLDLDADRRHASKRFRPLASGDLPINWGIVGTVVLPVAAFAIALFTLPFAFVFALLFYYFLTNAYSFFLKRISTADVMTLAVLYTLRIVAGASAVGVLLSTWLMAFSIFVFVSLAYLKRYVEVSMRATDAGRAAGRGYSAEDSETMFTLGIANITASVVILALYVNSEEVGALYKTPEFLWLLCFLMLYWGNRIWIGARRKKIDDDPVVFALKDNVSRLIGVGFLIVVFAAKYV